MSGTVLRTGSVQKRRSRLPAIAAVVGLLAAAGWVMAMRQARQQQQRAQQSEAMERAGVLVELLRESTQKRVAADAQMLAQDPRLQSTLAVSNVDDATILDILQDLQKLNGEALFAVLTPTGTVRVVLGAPKIKGLDLSTSSVVKRALAQDTAALGTWLVDDRVEEVAVMAVRAGDRPVALLAIGARLDDQQLSKLAKGAGVHLALMVEDKPVWSDATMPGAWTGPNTARFEVNGSIPPAQFIAAPLPPAPDNSDALIWMVPGLAVVFAVLAFWRGGAS
ncbi:MAG: cache domain-containing protein [Myxococcaceae bacterium]